MSDEMKNDVSPTVALFQKTHASLVTLHRLDDQIAGLAEKRRKIQGELREAQAMLNEEIDRAAEPANAATMKIASAPGRRHAAAADEAMAEAA